jgi:hypothetical protein
MNHFLTTEHTEKRSEDIETTDGRSAANGLRKPLNQNPESAAGLTLAEGLL